MTPEQLALSEAIALAGGQSELARKLTASSGHLVKQQHVWNGLVDQIQSRILAPQPAGRA